MEKILELKTIEPTALLGVGDSHIKLIEKAIPATIIVRGEEIKIQGDQEAILQVQEVLHEMMQTFTGKGSLTVKDVQRLITLIKANVNGMDKTNTVPEHVIHYGRKGAISAKTEGQNRYVEMVNNNDVVFSIGPAGTGKTFLSVAFSVAALESHRVCLLYTSPSPRDS